VVTPSVVACGAAGEGLAGDSFNRAVGHGALEGMGGNAECDVLASPPEGTGEVVREEESVVAALLIEES